MRAMLALPDGTKPPGCQVRGRHSPKPLRYVWHHILPRTCGGQTVPSNLANLCDGCHYAVHLLLSELKRTGLIGPRRGNHQDRVALAQRGYDLARAAGTVAAIPNEGSL